MILNIKIKYAFFSICPIFAKRKCAYTMKIQKIVLIFSFTVLYFWSAKGQKDVEYLENELYKIAHVMDGSSDHSLQLSNDQKIKIYEIANQKYITIASVDTQDLDKYSIHMKIKDIDLSYQSKYEGVLTPEQRIYYRKNSNFSR